MRDTTGEVDRVFRAMLLGRSSEERLRMGGSMYAAARALYADILADSMSELKKPLRHLFQVCEEMVTERKDAGEEDVALLSREVRERTGLPAHQVKRGMAELVELEYLAPTRGVRGAATAYRLVDVEKRQQSQMEGL
ncbi:MAG: hypothetical protein AAB328_03120, partial [candidate division NC10 bacterium]